MPNAKKPKNNTKKPRRYKKRAFNSKLRDKKINTLVERRMQEIARKEDRKNFNWLSPRIYIHDAAFNWVTHGPILRVPSASCLTINAATLWHLRMSDFGMYLENNLASQTVSERLTNYIRCKAMKARFDFRYGGSYPQHVKIFLVQVSGGQELDIDLTVPSADMTPGGDLNGQNEFWQRTLREQVPYKYRILKQMSLTLPPAKIYIPAYPINNQNQTVWNAPVNTEVQKIVNFSHIFKDAGKRFSLVHDDIRAPRQEVYLCAISDGVMTFNAVCTSVFRLDGIQDQIQPIQTTPT